MTDDIKIQYDVLLASLARLAPFSVARDYPWGIEVQDRIEKHACEEIVSFAVSARRFIEASNGVTLAKNVDLPILKEEFSASNAKFIASDRRITIWRVLGVIIHNEYLWFIKTEREVRTHFEKNFKSSDFMFTDGETFPPVARLKSDKSPMINVRVRDLVSRFEDKLLDPLVDELADKGVFLESI